MLLRLIDRRESISSAVDAPRMHPSPDGTVQIEPGFTPAELDPVIRDFNTTHWQTRDFYFGGVHLVRRSADGTVSAVGDGRRGGRVVLVEPAEMSDVRA
jgi:gamma-glutamyltranspeptidase/glutathione hydrolase